MAAILRYSLLRGGVPAVLCWAERVLLPQLLPSLSAPSAVLGLPSAFGLVCLVNIVGTSFMAIVLGFKVGASRSSFMDKAKKDGDEHAEARYSYPKMYAEGFDEHARNFNCVQRAHQHTLETHHIVLLMSLVGGLTQPVTTALAGLLWIVSRHMWASGYSTGDPKNRYEQSGGWGRHIWSSLLMLSVTCTATGLKCLGVY